MSDRRATDPEGFDATGERKLLVTLESAELRELLSGGRLRVALLSAAVAAVVALIVAAVLGVVGVRQVTDTVRSDVGRASTLNCLRVNKIKPALASLRDFLSSDAAYARTLATLDREQQRLYAQSATITGVIGRTLASLGAGVPSRLGAEYDAWAAIDHRQEGVFGQLEQARRASAWLWSGPRNGRTVPLADRIQLIGTVSCAKVLLP